MTLSFKELEELAREVEQAGDLSYAAAVWFKAANAAKKAINKDWALKRGAFCERWNGRIVREA